MAQKPPPVNIRLRAKLSDYDIAQHAIAFKDCTLESDRYVCVRQKTDSTSEDDNATLILLDLKNTSGNDAVIKKAMKAESVICHPTQKILALRAPPEAKSPGRTIQVFDLGRKEKLKTCHFNPKDDSIVFWKWISTDTLGIVTTHAVYHWNVIDSASPAPVKVLDHAKLWPRSDIQVINYRTNADATWMAVVAISKGRDDTYVRGHIELYSKERKIAQLIEGHAVAFSSFPIPGSKLEHKLFSFVSRTQNAAKLHIIEVDHSSQNPPFQKSSQDIFFPPDAVTPPDFPVALHVAEKYKIVIMLTKKSMVHLFDLETGTPIYVGKATDQDFFTACPNVDGSGVTAISRDGRVIDISINDDAIIPFLCQDAQKHDLALNLASRASLAGAEQLFQLKFNQVYQQFHALCASHEYEAAALLAANSPKGCLRTQETIATLKAAPAANKSTPLPVLQYFSQLLENGSLNEVETLELVQPVIQQGRIELLNKWLLQDKLCCTEHLGMLVVKIPEKKELALEIFHKAKAYARYLVTLAELGRLDKILPYCKETGYTPDFNDLLLQCVRINPENAVPFAIELAKEPAGPLIDIYRAFCIFKAQNGVQHGIQNATAFALDVLPRNWPEDALFQTELLELNLSHAPKVADAILGQELLSHYDKARIAAKCEEAGLYKRALELYAEPGALDSSAIRRIVVGAVDKLDEEFLLKFFGNLTPELSLESLDEMLSRDIRLSLKAVIAIAQKYAGELGLLNIVALLEKHRTAEGLYFFLGSVIHLTQDKDVTFKYIEAATAMGQFDEVERVCRESQHYDAEKVKNFLKEANLQDQLPLIIVCDRFNFVHDLILYLYKHKQFQSIEIYVQRINPSRTPSVVAGLLDVDCEDNVIKNLVDSVNPTSVPIDELVAEVESRNRLKLLLPFLEKTLASGAPQQQAVFNALAKIYIDSNNNPEKFLRENDQYDTLIVGKYCEKRDPNLAYIAYAKGQNDIELVNITNENSMFKAQSRYVLERANPDVWKYVLNDDNVFRRPVIEAIVSQAVPESQDPDKVSIAVKAFLDQDLPGELIELLEKILLEPTIFSDNPTLQTLLLFTAAKSDKGRVMNYVHQLKNYSHQEVAEQLKVQDMFDEAFEVYRKNDKHVEAVGVLVDDVMSIDRAQEYADRVDLPQVWSKVAQAQLQGLRVADAIDSYIRAEDPANFSEVIDLATSAGKDEELVKYLRMARRTLRETAVDTGLAFCYARLNQLVEMAEFLRGPNVADVEASGDKSFAEGHFEAAKIFFSSISNWAKLAPTLVELEDHQAAVDCARKANSTKVWKQVNQSCVSKKEFTLAMICGLNLIVHGEELAGVVQQYEYNGYFDELISLLSDGLGLERAHMGMFTELGVALTKYQPERVFEHIRTFWTRLNMHKMTIACTKAHLWPEVVFLYHHDEEFDNAVLTMMERAADAWDHNSLKEIISKVNNLEIYYRAVLFYRDEHPGLLTDLLATLSARIDVNRVVKIFDKSDNLPLIKSWLLNQVQKQNKQAVNSAIHGILIEEEDYKTLRHSVEEYDNYDSQELAERLEKHDLVFFRQIAASIWRRTKRWQKSIELSKMDKLYSDAIETAGMSGQTEVVKDLLTYFVGIGSRENYVGMLYACYDLLDADHILELSWRHGLHNFTMPYFINVMSQQAAAIGQLQRENEERKAREATAQKKDENKTPILAGSRLLLTSGAGQPNGLSSGGGLRTGF